LREGEIMTYPFRFANIKSITTPVLIVILALFAGTGTAYATDPGRIVFVANPSGSWQLYTIDPDGNNMVQVTDLAATDFEVWFPDISPDGRQIVFSYGPVDDLGNPLPDLYVINVDGTGLTALTNDGRSQSPRWSADGKWILFTQADAVSGGNRVARMRTDRTGGTTVLTNRKWDSFIDSFTPDGKKILFDSDQDGFVSALWLCDLDGKHQKQLTRVPIEGGVADISPNGQHIVFTDHVNTVLSSSILVMNIDGTSVKKLTHGKAHDVWPSYSPDGAGITFVSDRMNSDYNFDLFVMGADGKNLKRIATGLTVGGCPDGNCVVPSWGSKPKQ
jgi:TolB protein